MPSQDEPAVQFVSEDEQRALRLALTYALAQGLASDDLDQERPSNRSLVSLARRVGAKIPNWCEQR